MGIDLPPITSSDIQTELNKPQAQEVLSIGSCENPDFQKQFQFLQSQTKNETLKLQNEITFTEKQKEILRKIYQNLGEDNTELKKAIENQTIKIFEIPNRDLVALSIDGKNIDYLYNSKGEIYFNFIDIKKSEIKDWFYIAGRKLCFDVSYNITTGEVEFKNKDNNSPVLSLSEKAIINTKIADLLKNTGKRIIDAIDTLEAKERDH